jgi:CheY-like chemotaxis protein
MTTRKKILIVEDNRDCRELQACFIERLGYEVFEADTGVAAIEKALTNQPDLILMDLAMPKMDGEEAMRRLKAHPATRHIPIIVCTAFAAGSHIDEALSAGAAGILHTPFKFADLDGLFRKHMPDKQKYMMDIGGE